MAQPGNGTEESTVVPHTGAPVLLQQEDGLRAGPCAQRVGGRPGERSPLRRQTLQNPKCMQIRTTHPHSLHNRTSSLAHRPLTRASKRAEPYLKKEKKKIFLWVAFIKCPARPLSYWRILWLHALRFLSNICTHNSALNLLLRGFT